MSEFNIEQLDPRDLSPNPQNWRRHPDKQKEALAASMAEHGWLAAPIWNRRTGHLVDGHARVEQAVGIGVERIPVRVIDVSEEQEKRILASFDRITGLADPDNETLAGLLKELADSDGGLPPGYDDGDLDDLLDSLGASSREAGAGGDDYEPQATGVPERARMGDLWLLGGEHYLLVGDCTCPVGVGSLFTLAGSTVDCLVTDPPYGVSVASKNARLNKRDGGKRLEKSIAGDSSTDGLSDTLQGAFKNTKWSPENTAYVFMSDKGILSLLRGSAESGLKRAANLLVWVKNCHVLTQGDYNAQHELIWYGWSGKHKFHGPVRSTTVLNFDKPSKNDLHPTMKPVDLLGKLIHDGSEKNDTIYDPFAGSGSTFIAAHRSGRKCLGVEIDPKYADVILHRMEQETGIESERVSNGE